MRKKVKKCYATRSEVSISDFATIKNLRATMHTKKMHGWEQVSFEQMFKNPDKLYCVESVRGKRAEAFSMSGIQLEYDMSLVCAS